MNTHHLTEEELGALLAGEASGSVREHVAFCKVCQEELKKWQVFLATGSQWLPEAQTRCRARERALMKAMGKKPLRRWVPLAAAAALVVVIGLATQRGRRPELNVDAVLEQVDTTLASDPLLAVADSQVVSVVVPDPTPGERSSS